MNNATLQAFRNISEAMKSTTNYAVQIEVDGKWQMVIDNITEPEAAELAGRWERSRVVKVASH